MFVIARARACLYENYYSTKRQIYLNCLCVCVCVCAGDPVDVIASGPTVADTSSYADALAVIDALRVTSLPQRAVERLQVYCLTCALFSPLSCLLPLLHPLPPHGVSGLVTWTNV